PRPRGPSRRRRWREPRRRRSPAVRPPGACRPGSRKNPARSPGHGLRELLLGARAARRAGLRARAGEIGIGREDVLHDALDVELEVVALLSLGAVVDELVPDRVDPEAL